MVAHPVEASRVEADIDAHLARLAPRPQSLEDTGLTQTFVSDLTAKVLLEGGTLSLRELVQRLGLSGKIVESVLHFMRQEARVEIAASGDSGNGLDYRLTDRGRASALDALLRSSYVGCAPVPLNVYAETVRAQSVHERSIDRSTMLAAFENVVIRDELLDRLGPSMNSGRPIFIYGPAGTGKTYIAQKLARLFNDRVLIPHAISVNETVVNVFDPVTHRALSPRSESGPELSLETGHDPRFVSCERPVVIAGGELTIDMLEVQHDPMTKEYRAPLQLKANNGLFLIDDMGRQKSPPEAIFNRWIVPMEEKKDYLSLGGGRHFSVPFNVLLLFSTNMHPLDLADEAFLRRIGYKIGFDYLTRDQYQRIWQDTCREKGVVFEQDTLDFVMDELHEKESVRMLPCHPRDLLGIAVDLAEYLGSPRRLTKQQLRWAWRNYFVSYDGASGART
ncbi:MAG: AAA family ATPase [Gammaproteobacteria bacterium]|nr:AAA family ATPase [Gammaproteobacteria bacterium]